MTAISPRIQIAPKRRQTVQRSLVNEAAAHAAATTEAPTEPNYRSIYLSTILGMSLLFLFGVGIPTAAVYGNATGWALGAFCAFWGGPSFGVMAGSARVSAWFEKHEGH